MAKRIIVAIVLCVALGAPILAASAPLFIPLLMRSPQPTASATLTATLTRTNTPHPTATITPSVTPTTTSGTGGTVYISPSGDKYHREDCRYVAGKATPVSCSWAQENGYEPCKVCEPECP